MPRVERLEWSIGVVDWVEAIVGPGARRLLGGAVAGIEPPVDRVAVVVDDGVPAGMVEELLDGLRGAGVPVSVLRAGGGEQAKSLDRLLELWRWFLGEGLTRRSLVVAVGGGAVTDSTGFAAATYMRGVRWATVPTTLLGMADAAIGGKTAVNLAGKNMVGAFHQPRVIVADVEFASTLPRRELRSGLAEVAKHSLLVGGGFYRGMWDRLEELCAAEMEALSWAVARSIEVKMSIVARDPREERGDRMLLNLGHTFAHGLEKASGFTIPHGYAVAIGLVVEARVAEKTVGLPAQERKEIVELLRGLGLPTSPPSGVGCSDVVAAARLDKKRVGDNIVLPLLRRIGEPMLHTLPMGEAERLLMEACREARGEEP